MKQLASPLVGEGMMRTGRPHSQQGLPQPVWPSALRPAKPPSPQPTDSRKSLL